MSSDSDLDVGVVVEDAESLFLTGNFRKALLLCNQVLRTSSNSSSSNNPGSSLPLPGDNSRNPKIPSKKDSSDDIFMNIRLQTPLNLFKVVDTSEDEIDRRLVVQVPSRNSNHHDNNDGNSQGDATYISSTDRAAAVALQSWYEIARSVLEETNNDNDTAIPSQDASISSRQQQQQSSCRRRKVAQGNVHLLPFLDTYTTNATTKDRFKQDDTTTNLNNPVAKITRSMPIEVSVVFCRFLRTSTVGQVHASLELSCEIMHRVVGALIVHDNDSATAATTTNIIPQHVRSCLEELFSLVCVETLPFVSSGNGVAVILKRFLLSLEETWKTAAKPLTISNTPSANAIFNILPLLDALPASWSAASFPSQDCIQHTRSSLRRLLKQTEVQNRQQGAYPPEQSILDDKQQRERKKVESGLMTEPFNNSSLAHFLAGTTNSLIQKWKDNKSTISFMLVMLLLAWRKRQRVGQMSSAALKLILAPIREVVDAILNERH